MVTINQARLVAFSLPEVEEKSHFHIPDLRVKNKIFATIHADKNYMMVSLPLIDPSVFCTYNKEIIFPVPGGWGLKGSAFLHLKKVKKAMLKNAFTTAWEKAAPHKLAEKYFGKK